MGKQLSPAAEAVLDAFFNSFINPDSGMTFVSDRNGLAAALRAAADQVVPEEPHPEESQFWDDEADREWQNNRHFREQLLAIADELESVQ